MTCAVCNRNPVQLHHHTYVRLGCEELDDVTPLCRPHHEGVHEWLKQSGRIFVEFTHEAVGFLSGTFTPQVRPARKAKTTAETKEKKPRKRPRKEFDADKYVFVNKMNFKKTNIMPVEEAKKIAAELLSAERFFLSRKTKEYLKALAEYRPHGDFPPGFVSKKIRSVIADYHREMRTRRKKALKSHVGGTK